MTNQPQYEQPSQPTATPPVMEEGYQPSAKDPGLPVPDGSYPGQQLVPEPGIVSA